MSEISDAGRALCYLSEQLMCAEEDVFHALREVLSTQESLRRAITRRDAIQQTLNMTARFVAGETK